MDLGKDKEEQMFQINVSKKGIKYNIVCTCRLLHLDIELGFFKMHQWAQALSKRRRHRTRRREGGTNASDERTWSMHYSWERDFAQHTAQAKQGCGWQAAQWPKTLNSRLVKLELYSRNWFKQDFMQWNENRKILHLSYLGEFKRQKGILHNIWPKQSKAVATGSTIVKTFIFQSGKISHSHSDGKADFYITLLSNCRVKWYKSQTDHHYDYEIPKFIQSCPLGMVELRHLLSLYL